MTGNIRPLFFMNIDLLERTDKAICYFREQQHDIALGIMADSMGLIRNSIEATIMNKEYFNLVSTDSVMEMLSGVLEAYKTSDYILLADLLELQLVSFIIGVQELIISKEEIGLSEDNYYENSKIVKSNSLGLEALLDEPIEPQIFLKKGYRVEFSSCGLMTLAARNDDSTFYFHTNSRIPLEALMLARHWYTKEVKKYYIYGLGFGYHIKELLSISINSEIIIYEEDLNVILLACTFSKLKDIFETGRVKLIYDPKLQELKRVMKDLQKDEAIYVHYPSYQNIKGEGERKLLMEYVSWSGND